MTHLKTHRSAGHAVNAIPHVAAAAPGIRSFILQQLTPLAQGNRLGSRALSKAIDSGAPFPQMVNPADRCSLAKPIIQAAP